MEIFLIVLLVIGVSIFSKAKVKDEKKQERRRYAEQLDRTRMTTHYDPPPAAVPQNVPGQIHLSEVLPDKKPPAVPGVREKTEEKQKPTPPTEGVAFHPPGFHGEIRPRLREEAMPEESTAVVRKPMFTPGQLREAFIMQEILDEPVSRRKGIRRGYGS